MMRYGKPHSLTALAIGVSVLFSSHARAALDYSSADVQALFNEHRLAQAKILPWPATYWPFNSSPGAGINHSPDGKSPSPAQKYDEAFSQKGAAAKWEELHHSCAHVSEDELAACREWYGHCNGWTGAALFNEEPSYDKTFDVLNPKTGKTTTFNFVDIKALLTEGWLDAAVSFEGTGMSVPAGDWIFDPAAAISQEPASNNPSLTNFEAYWDVSPRALFYALTTYIGEKGQALALDRYTGDEIWNQPILGYRFLPIVGNRDAPITRDGLAVYPVTFGLKIYWANDEVLYDYKRTDSLNWSIVDAKFSTDKVPDPPGSPWSQEVTADAAVYSRYMSFTLFFDAPVAVSADGTRIVAAGKLVGDGVWTHADPKQKTIWYSRGLAASQIHPDFLWRPDGIVGARYRNPYIDPRKIYEVILKQKPPLEIHSRDGSPDEN